MICIPGLHGGRNGDPHADPIFYPIFVKTNGISELNFTNVR
jgi:hypothetical protein